METVFYNKGGMTPIHRETAISSTESATTAWCGLSSSEGGTTWQKCDASKFSRRCLACFDAVASWCSLNNRWIVSAAGDARADVDARRSQHEHDAVRHVLAAVVARALDDRLDTGVAHAEAIAGLASGEELSGSGTIETRVAD